MRARTRAAAAGVGLLALVLTGCSLPEGVDGDLTGGWADLPEPTGFVPDVGVCHDQEYAETGPLSEYEPVPCAEPHITETVHVGEFGDGSADDPAPPSEGTGQWRAAFRECDEQAADYLGADFRYARLWLGVTVPSTDAWAGGARWFRCDVLLYEVGGVFGESRTGSLAGALSDGSGLRLTCFEVELEDGDQTIQEMDPVGCDEPHHAEFVGVWEAPDDGYLDGADTDSAQQVHSGCREEVAEFVDVPVDDDLQFRTGTIADWMEEEDWDNGDRKFRCYLWLNGDEIEGSLAGEGTSALPVR